MTKLKIAYLGTPSFSARFLEMILNDKNLPVEIVLVVTQPDKPVGRNHILTPSPVKEVAKKYKIEVFLRQIRQQNFRRSQLSEQASSNETLVMRGARRNERSHSKVGMRVDLLRKFSLAHLLKDLRVDLALLFAYGEIIPKDLLNLPRLGFWNIHPSLLPAYRGASPIAYPIMLNDTETGVTLIQMDDLLDHGPIIAQEKIKILPDDRRVDLEDKLTQLAFHVFKASINTLTREPVNPLALVKQDDSLATFTHQLKKSDGFVPFLTLKKDLIDRSQKLYNLFRALYPWPGIWTTVIINFSQKRLKITDMKMKNNALSVTKVQLEGKNEVDFETFNRAYKLL